MFQKQRHVGPVQAITSFFAVFALILGVIAGGGTTVCADSWPKKNEDYSAPDDPSHPRLFLPSDRSLDQLRSTAQEDWAKKLIERMHKALLAHKRLAVQGRNRAVLKEAGYKAAGYASVYALEEKEKQARKAADVIVNEVIGYPMKQKIPLIGLGNRLQGTAFTYDLCYDAWSEERRKKIKSYLQDEQDALLKKVGGPKAEDPNQPAHMIIWMTVGLVELSFREGRSDERLQKCEKALKHYLDTQVGETGLARSGEAPRQAVYGSAILPFVWANRCARGRDFSEHPAIQNSLMPQLFQSVPGVGMPVTGKGTSSLDRSGLFALGTNFSPEDRRPVIRWLFDALNGSKYHGIVRPHQVFYMLQSKLPKLEPKSPDNLDLDPFVRDEKSGITVFRSGWKDSNDIVFLTHGSNFRLLGLGAHWVGRPGRHSHMYSHDPAAGAFENVFRPDTKNYGDRVYKIKTVQSEIKKAHVSEDANTMSLSIGVSGELKRTKKEVKKKVKKDGEEKEITKKIDEGGDFKGKRIVGVDYSGKSGASAVFVFRDKIEGGGNTGHFWNLHAGRETKFKVKKKRFIVKSKKGKNTLVGHIVNPEKVKLNGDSNPPYTNFITATTKTDHLEVVLTLQKEGEAPEVERGDKGLSGGIKVGDRNIKLDDGRIQFSK